MNHHPLKRKDSFKLFLLMLYLTHIVVIPKNTKNYIQESKGKIDY